MNTNCHQASAEEHAASWPVGDQTLESVLREFEARQADEDSLIATLSSAEMVRRRDEWLISVGRSTGVLLNLLVRESRARSILELGTAFGYSTLWLADAARAIGGRVLTIDAVADKQQRASMAIERAGLRQFVEFRCQDALDFLAQTHDRYQFVLLDLWKDAYVPALELLLPHLDAGATIIADNMYAPSVVRAEAAAFLRRVQSIAGLDTVLLPVGNGLALTRYKAEQPTHRAAV